MRDRREGWTDREKWFPTICGTELRFMGSRGLLSIVSGVLTGVTNSKQ